MYLKSFVSNTARLKPKMFSRFLFILCVLMTIGSLATSLVTDGEFTMSGDKRDYITGGKTYTYSTGAGDRINVNFYSGLDGVSISIDGYNGDNWSMDLHAPQGKRLLVGEYLNATRYPFNEAGPGLSVSGNGRGCNTLLGSFVTKRISIGPNDEDHRLEATFEQHCEGGPTALRGSVSIGHFNCAWTLCGEACELQSDGYIYLCNFRDCGLRKQFFCCRSRQCSD